MKLGSIAYGKDSLVAYVGLLLTADWPVSRTEYRLAGGKFLFPGLWDAMNAASVGIKALGLDPHQPVMPVSQGVDVRLFAPRGHFEPKHEGLFKAVLRRIVRVGNPLKTVCAGYVGFPEEFGFFTVEFHLRGYRGSATVFDYHPHHRTFGRIAIDFGESDVGHYSALRLDHELNAEVDGLDWKPTWEVVRRVAFQPPLVRLPFVRTSEQEPDGSGNPSHQGLPAHGRHCDPALGTNGNTPLADLPGSR